MLSLSDIDVHAETQASCRRRRRQAGVMRVGRAAPRICVPLAPPSAGIEAHSSRRSTECRPRVEEVLLGRMAVDVACGRQKRVTGDDSCDDDL